MEQPTIRRLNASRTAQQYSHPSRVRCCVMSVIKTHLAGAGGNLRLTRSSAVTTPRSRLSRAGTPRPVDAGLGHQHRHRARAHRDAYAQGEFGADAAMP